VGTLRAVSGRRWNSETLVCGVSSPRPPDSEVADLRPEHSGVGRSTSPMAAASPVAWLRRLESQCRPGPRASRAGIAADLDR